MNHVRCLIAAIAFAAAPCVAQTQPPAATPPKQPPAGQTPAAPAAQTPAAVPAPTAPADEAKARHERLLKATRLPKKASEIRAKGVPDGEMKDALDAAKAKGVKADEMSEVADEQSKAIDDHGPIDNFGAFVKGKLGEGLRGRELSNAIKAEHAKRGKGKGFKGKAEGKGKPDGKGDDKGKGEEHGKPDGKGKPDDKAKSDDKGKPDEKGHDKGKSNEKGKGK